MPRAHRERTRHTGIYALTLGDGRTRYVATWRDVDGRQREHTYPRLSDAIAARGAALADRDRGVSAPTRADARRPLEVVALEWLAAGLWRPSTRATHESILTAHVLPAFGARQVGTITTHDVRRWVAGMLAAGAAPTTVTARRNVLSAVLESAHTRGMIPANVAASVSVPRAPRTPADRAAALDPAQVGALLDALPDRVTPYALTLVTTGLRPSEGAGLTVDRVDFLRRTLTVDRQLTGREGDAPVFGPVKTAASARVVPLPDALGTALAAHLAEHGPGPDGLLFTTPRSGAPLTRTPRGDLWRRATRELDLPAAVRGWHSLRHTYASTLLAAGADLPTVARLLGHATTAETAATYAHAIPGRDELVRNVAGDLFAATVGTAG